MKFSLTADSAFELLNPDFCQYHGAGDCFLMVANNRQGQAVQEVQVVPGLPCFHIPDFDQRWESDKLAPLLKRETVIRKGKARKEDPTSQCADHVVFLYDTHAQSWDLHIFEMKTTMGQEAWKTVRRQLNGALYRAWALGGVLMRNCGFHSVHTHCVYQWNWNDRKTRDIIDIEAEASGIIQREEVHISPEEYEWENPAIQLSLFPGINVSNRGIRLDDSGHAKIALNGTKCVIISV